MKDNPQNLTPQPRKVNLEETVISSESGSHFIRNVFIKTAVLFLVANLLFALFYPMEQLGKLSLYNQLFPGRPRLPYGDNPDRAYNLSLYNLEAMYASHEIALDTKPEDEFRVVLIGDSSTWGFLLPHDDTLSSNLNKKAAQLPNGRKLRFYNLGYPVMSLTKDLLILSDIIRYQPDLIVWLVTLESFPYDKQLFPPLLQNNAQAVSDLILEHKIKLDPNDPTLLHRNFWERTLIGERRNFADLLRLQFFGPLWAATGIDQEIPTSYTPRQEDLDPDASFHNLNPPNLDKEELAIEMLEAGINMANPVPVLIINEPIFISQGANSHIRYNFFYPRWAYDDYRRILADQASQNNWPFRDFWDQIPGSEFTNSAVHLSSRGSRQLADLVLEAVFDTIQSEVNP